MKHSERFTNAVTKLYNAFHKGELNALDSCFCAVGNLCNNNHSWSNVISFGNLRIENYIGETKMLIDNTGYNIKELAEIEVRFCCGLSVIDYQSGKEEPYWADANKVISLDKDSQFQGLCAVIEYLCELEGIPNIMDYTCLFETENNEPKYQLENVFV